MPKRFLRSPVNVIAVARRGAAALSQMAKHFGMSASPITWRLPTLTGRDSIAVPLVKVASARSRGKTQTDAALGAKEQSRLHHRSRPRPQTAPVSIGYTSASTRTLFSQHQPSQNPYS
jgi:hypothetical protein